MNEDRLKAICQKTGWNLKWTGDYFTEERFENDIFYDLIEEQGFGFSLDWKFIAMDVLDGIKQCTPIDVTIVNEAITLSTLVPFNQDVERYRTVTLARGSTQNVITYTIDEPRYLAKEILSFADYEDKEVIDIGQDGDDTYLFTLLNKGLSQQDVEPFTYHKPPQNSSSEVLVRAKQAAQSKYFYLPIFATGIKESYGDNSAGEISLLSFKSGELFKPDYYASRVLTGQTLEDAVKKDLATDFNYHGNFKISDYRLLDTTPDKQGNQLPRLIVNVEVERFMTEGLHVLSTTLKWQTFPLDVMGRQVRLGFNLHEQVVS